MSAKGIKQRRKVGFSLEARLAYTIRTLAAVLDSSPSSVFTGSEVGSLQKRFHVFTVTFLFLGIENNLILLSPQANDLDRGQVALQFPPLVLDLPKTG
jgi:hypothetical protein